MMNKPKRPIRVGLGIFISIIVMGLILFACSSPDDKPVSGSDDKVFTAVDIMPEFPGGMDSLAAYLGRSINYPESAKENGIEGKVIVGYTVEKDGSISQVEVVDGISEECNKEAARVISSMPDWSPGLVDNKAVAVSLKLPILFKLDEKEESDSVHKVVDVMPEYPGGINALMKYLATNIKYPEKAKKEKISGKVFVQFVVGKDGSIESAEVLRGIGGGCDEEALRVIRSMPDWKPGMHEGAAVRVEYNIPINFALD